MRATPKKFIKTLFITSIMCFVVVNLNLFLRAGPGTHYDDTYFQPQPEGGVVIIQEPSRNVSALQAQRLLNNSQLAPSGGLAQNRTTIFVPPPPNQQLNLPKSQKSPNSSSSAQQGDPRLLLPSIQNRSLNEIKELVRKANREQRILNLDRFELAASDSTVVVVVQVHNRVEYLYPLIDSLRKSQHIEQALLVFSHDFFSDEINKVIAAIDFCPVMQIFYPFAIQIHPHEFPGESPGDCPRDINKEEAMKRECLNAKFPDKYGHYREAKYCQTKHHWFWKLSHVFDNLDVTSTFNGPVLFIEEDHYMVEDFIPVLRKMYRLREKSCPDCSIFTIGTYDKRPAYGPMASRLRPFSKNGFEVDITNWVSSKHNMGMSFNREIWTKIRNCAQNFCAFDDYNWDWSLHNIGMSCIPDKLRVMVSKSPRVYHIGECGVHHKGKNCNAADKVRQIETILQQNKQWLFPDAVAVGGYPRAPAKMPKPNGGWGDIRDHELCMSFLRRDTHR